MYIHKYIPNLFVLKDYLSLGLRGCIQFHLVFFARYLRDLHNAFHGGLGVTYHDCVMGSEECEQALLLMKLFFLYFLSLIYIQK